MKRFLILMRLSVQQTFLAASAGRKKKAKVASAATTLVMYGLIGVLIILSMGAVYAGMVVGVCSRNEDMSVNVCKKKQLTNMRAAGSDDAIRLAPPKVLSLEQCLEYLADDELLEVTPKSLRIRKRILDHSARMRAVMKNK